MEPGLDVSIVPYLYDLGPDHTGRLFLESVQGDMVVLAWMFPRAAFWLLDRDGIKGHYGENQLTPPAETDEDEEGGEPEPPKGIGAVDVPDRHIYCLDLRDHNNHDVYVEEVRRIAAECRERREAQLKTWIQGKPTLVQLGRYLREDGAGPADAAVRPGAVAATAGPALVSGDRLQPLHQLHGVPRFLPVRRLRRGQAGPHHWSRTRTTASRAVRRAAGSVPSRRSCSPTTRRRPSPAPRSAPSAA